MNYNKQKESISLVIVGQFEPIYLHAKWMYDKGLLTQNEQARLSISDKIISPKLSRFIVEDCFDFLCNENRIQLQSADISYAARLSKLAKNILSVLSYDNINAIGVNADMDFCFLNDDDQYNFGKHFVNLNAWDGILDNARAINFTITEQIDTEQGRPKRTLLITTKAENNPQTIIQIAINNHYSVTSLDDINSAIDLLDKKSQEFRELYATIFEAL